MTTRDEFEAHMRRTRLSNCERLPDGDYFNPRIQDGWEIWQAATKRENEACADLASEFSDDYMQQAREGDQSGASDHKACAAVEIADAIRSRSKEQG